MQEGEEDITLGGDGPLPSRDYYSRKSYCQDLRKKGKKKGKSSVVDLREIPADQPFSSSTPEHSQNFTPVSSTRTESSSWPEVCAQEIERGQDVSRIRSKRETLGPVGDHPGLVLLQEMFDGVITPEVVDAVCSCHP